MRTQPFDVLVALRPSSDIPVEWTDNEQLAARQRIVTSAYPVTVRTRSTRRRALIAGAVAFAVALGGVGAATATGLLPSKFTDAYQQSFHDQPLTGQSGIDPATAARVSTQPGPNGSIFTVMVAKGSGSYVCITSLFEAAPVSGPWPSTFDDAGSVCQTDRENNPFKSAFGESSLNPVYKRHAMAVTFTAGKAATAEIRTVTGQVIPMVLVEGWLYGWFPLEVSPAGDFTPERFPTVTGYATDGSVVGTFRLDD
jgi:hypothetical protein